MLHRSVGSVRSFAVALTLAALTTAAAPARADVVDVGGLSLEVEYFAGVGDNTSYAIIDFAAQAGGVYAFGYRWDPLDSPDGLDMLAALDAAGSLDVVITSFSFGDAVTNLSYNGDTGVPLFDFFFGEYWLGEVGGGSIAWTSAPVGAGDRTLTDGSFDGWVNTFDGVEPRAVAITPTPTAAAMGAVGVALLLVGRRRRNRG